jgi:hypothetical protein
VAHLSLGDPESSHRNTRCGGIPESTPLARWVEQFPTAGHLGVGAVPDLWPDGIRRVGIGKSLGDDALEVEPLDRCEEVPPLPADAKDGRQDGACPLHQPAQNALSAGERAFLQILALEPEHIENRIVQVAATAHEEPEILSPLLIQGDHLAVKDDVRSTSSSRSQQQSCSKRRRTLPRFDRNSHRRPLK